MSLPDLASLGSFVSGIAVLGSLVFLYLQMRQIGAQIEQAERNQRAAIRAETHPTRVRTDATAGTGAEAPSSETRFSSGWAGGGVGRG